MNAKIIKRRHLKKRLAQRFNIVINKEDQRKLIREIQQGKHKFHSRVSHRVTRWIVSLNEKQAIVLYDSKRHVCVTAYPLKVSARDTEERVQ